MDERIRQLRDERARLFADAQKLLKAERLTAEDEAKFDAIMAEIDRLTASIGRLERAQAVEQELNARVEQRAGREGISTDEQQAREQQESKVFAKWLRGGIESLSGDERALMLSRATSTIYAAQGVGTGSAGGYLVPQAFSDRIEVALKQFSAMVQVADTIVTATGADLPWPTVNDTTVTGAILAENAPMTSQDITFGQVVLKSYMYTSRLIAVSYQLMQDSFMDLERFIADKAGERIGRILNTHFTTGTGSGQPNGVVTAAAQGKVGATGQTTTVTYDDLVDLEMSVDAAYRSNARWMLNDSSLAKIKKLKDSQNRPLWIPSIDNGTPDRLLGYPIVPNNDMPSMQANAKSILFGDFSRYKIRRTADITLVRLNERYADNLQVGFFAFVRADGNLIDAGTNPVKYYQNSAT